MVERPRYRQNQARMKLTDRTYAHTSAKISGKSIFSAESSKAAGQKKCINPHPYLLTTEVEQPPLSVEGMFQALHWMPATADRTEPHTYCSFFPYNKAQLIN